MLKVRQISRRRSRRLRRMLTPLAAVALAGSLCAGGVAQETWVGGSGDMSDNANWADGSAPVSGASNLSLVFTGPSTTTMNQDYGSIFELQEFAISGNGSLTLSGGPIRFNNLGLGPTINHSGSRNLLFNSDVDLAATLSVVGGSNSGVTTFAGVASGGGGLSIEEANVTLSGNSNNTYTGETIVGDGANLRLNKLNATAVVGDLTIDDGFASIEGSGGDQISDSSVVTVRGSGFLFVREVETIGQLNLQGNERNSSTVSIRSGGALSLAGDLVSLANGDSSGSGSSVISGSGTLDLGAAVRNFDVADSVAITNDLYVTAIVTGGSINKTGLGKAYLSNANSTIDNVTATEGTISVNGSSILGTLNALANGTVDLNGGIFSGDVSGPGKFSVSGNAEFWGNYMGAQSIDVLGSGQLKTNVATLGSEDVNLETSISKLELNETSDSTYSGSINGFTASSSGQLIKTGAGVLTLDGTSDYSGKTDVQEGGIKLGAANALTGSAGLGVAAGAHVELNDFNLSIGSLEGDGDIDLGSGDLEVNQTSATTFGGNLSGTGDLTVNSSSRTLTFNAQQSFSGDTMISGGRLALAVDEVLDDSSNLTLSSSGVLTLDGNETVNEFTLESGQLNGSGSLTASSFNIESGSVIGDLAGTGALTKTGSGTADVYGTTTYSGGTTIDEGVLRTVASEVLNDSGAVVINSGELALGFSSSGLSETVGHVELNGGMISGDASTLISDSDFELRAGTVSAMLAGAGGINKTTAGTVSLNESNSFSGDIGISEGSLWASSGALSDGAVMNDATLRLSTGSFSNEIFGTGNVETVSSVTLSGVNTHSGGTDILSGTLTVGSADSLGSGAISFANNSMLRFDNVDDQTLDLQLSGEGGIYKGGSGELLVTASNSHSGTNTLWSGGLAIGNDGAIGTGRFDMLSSTSLRADGGTRTIGNEVSLIGSQLEFTGSENLNLTNVNDMLLESGDTWTFSNTATTELRGDFKGEFGSTVDVTGGHLIIGDANSFTGYQMAGDLQVAAGAEVTLNSAGYIDLAPLTMLSGGTLGASNGFALGASENVVGTGTLNGKIAAQLGSVISATGSLTLGDADSVVGFHSDGELRVNANKVMIYDANDIVLGTLTQVGDGGARGALGAGTASAGDTHDHFLLQEGRNLIGRGEISGNFKNQGHVIGDGTAADERIVFGASWDVSGIGEFENTLVMGNFNPGNSPGIATGTNQAFAGGIEIELGGLAAGFGDDHHDQIVDEGRIDLFNGAYLEVVDWQGFAPELGDEFEILKWQDGLYGDFDSLLVDSYFIDQGITFETFHTGTLQGGSGSLWLRSIAAVPEPAAGVVLFAVGIGGVLRRRRA